MSSNWVNALDACAAAGVIDYDAPAFITGKQPRYVGHPQMESLPLKNDFLLPPGIKLKDVPAFDTYKNPEDRPLVQNPTWKKVLFGVIAAAGLIACGIGLSKLHKLKMPKISTSSINFKNIKNGIVKVAKKLWNYVKAPFLFIAKKIKP